MRSLVFDGGIEIICGPMFSGKTEELLRKLNRFAYAKIPFIIFKHSSDTREFDVKNLETNTENEMIVSRNGIGINNRVFKAKNSQDLLDIVNDEILKMHEFKVIAIDEAQFFDLGLVDVVNDLAFKGYHIIIAGLDMTYNGEPFQVIAQLACLCDEIKKLTAICTICHAPANFSQLVVQQKDHDTSTPLIGNNEYQARCRKHFYPHNKK